MPGTGAHSCPRPGHAAVVACAAFLVLAGPAPRAAITCTRAAERAQVPLWPPAGALAPGVLAVRW